MIPVLIVSACAPAVPAGPGPLSNLQVQQSPTLAVLTTATKSTEPQINAAKPPLEVRLSAITSRAKLFRGGEFEIELQQAQAANIQVDDGIEVVKLEEQDEQSYSVLDFADYLEVELFSNTSVFLKELRQGAGDVTHVILHLDRGNIFVHLNEQKTTHVTVQTLYTTIKTLTSGTEFDVCYNEELTCVLVKKGVVEVTVAKGRKFIVKAGEAGYVLKDESPSATICAPTPVFIVWEERFRRFADAPALDQELSLLPQKPCPVTSADLPINARILYRDEFRNPSSGWHQGTIDNFIVRYVRVLGRRYYQVQVQGPHDQYVTSVPNEREYGDVNVDLRAVAEAESNGDFRYGLIFRRSGDQYYAFVISPRTQTWYFLKSSSNGLETLTEGTNERMRGLEDRNILRVESYGSIFLLFINDRFIDWISDLDYASGEVGLFVETIDSSDAIIDFDSIIIWDVPPAVQDPNQGAGESCFNSSDDDGDGLIDRADPDCQRLDLVSTALPLPANTSIPTRTPLPPSTNTPRPPTSNPPSNTPVPPVPTIQPPLPTILPPLPTVLPPLPTLLPPLPTILPPISTILPPLPTIQLPLRAEPSVESPTPK